MKQSTALLIQDAQGCYLVMQRSASSSHFPNRWEFPGGKLEAGEKPQEAMLREVREETGLIFHAPAGKPFCVIPVKTGELEYVFFARKWPGPRPKVRLSKEHQAVQWLSWVEARDLDPKLMEPHRECLERHWHQKQILAYTREHPFYEKYAAALERVLKKACAFAIPEAVVQARAKSISSFAEKCLRKAGKKHPDPVHDLTDLCGGRVITQTLKQVEAVKLFVEKNFQVIEKDDKASRLNEDTFGYRDMHYLVRLLPERAALIGFKPEEIKAIGTRVTELQVRSLVQHAWADILHDRVYKTPLRLATETKRTGALLSAIMEHGDQNFNSLAIEIDRMVANYAAYATRADVNEEISVHKLILAGEKDPAAKTRVALQLARLFGPCGKYEQVVQILDRLTAVPAATHPMILVELGHARCRVHRDHPKSSEYLLGQAQLEEAIKLINADDLRTVPNLLQRDSLLARALSRLAWSWEAVANGETTALLHYRAALELQPDNPYHLASQLGFEIFCNPHAGVVDSLRTEIRQAIAKCREHALAGTELPYALFTAGRLYFLLGDATLALGWYARGLRHFFDGHSCVSDGVLADEVDWVRRIHRGAVKLPEDYDWIERLIQLGRSFSSGGTEIAPQHPATSEWTGKKVLVIAGGAASMAAPTLKKLRPYLQKALLNFQGIVISGGTTIGIPGCVGEIAAELNLAGRKRFKLYGYIPRHLPANSPKDLRYDDWVEVSKDSDFSPGQVLRTWEDLLANSVKPSDVIVLGFGGGRVAAAEFQIALSLGATVAVAAGSGGAADAIMADPIWNGVPALFAFPLDEASIQALVTAPASTPDPAKLIDMAKAFHAHYISDNPGKLPENFRPWDKLKVTYQTANLEQARYAVEILRAAGFEVRPKEGGPGAITSFAGEHRQPDVARMAELEHGRWNIERLRAGWRFGPKRDNDKKTHDCLVSWQDLPDDIREYDRTSIRAFPEILGRAGLEIFRPAG